MVADTSHAPVPSRGYLLPPSMEEEIPHDIIEQIRAGWLLAQRSQHTRNAYQRDLDMWRTFLTEVIGLDLLRARRKHVDAWVHVREASHDSPATLSRRLASISAFYAYAAAHVDEHEYDINVTNPVALVKRPRHDSGSTTRALTAQEYRRLLEAAAQEPMVWGTRDAAVVAMLGLSGFRVSTLTSMNVNDLGAQGVYRTISYCVKGGGRKTEPLSPKTLTYLDSHLNARRKQGPMTAVEPLILANDGGRLESDQVRRIVTRCARRAGLSNPGGVGPHVLRATYRAVGETELSYGNQQDVCTTGDDQGLEHSPTYRITAHIFNNDPL